jgi:hypothetical protein
MRIPFKKPIQPVANCDDGHRRPRWCAVCCLRDFGSFFLMDERSGRSSEVETGAMFTWERSARLWPNGSRIRSAAGGRIIKQQEQSETRHRRRCIFAPDPPETSSPPHLSGPFAPAHRRGAILPLLMHHCVFADAAFFGHRSMRSGR